MFLRLILLSLGLFLCGCASTREVRPVWTQPTAPPARMPAPAGFAVTPAQAHSVVWKSRVLSLKHVWHIYADSRFYYVHDTFLGDSPRRALKQGVRVDGQSGAIVDRF